MEDRIDMDPRPRRSPALFGAVDAISHAHRVSTITGRKIPPWKLRQLRHMAIIVACRSAIPKVPYNTLVWALGISREQARLLYNMGCQRKLHNAKSR